MTVVIRMLLAGRKLRNATLPPRRLSDSAARNAADVYCLSKVRDNENNSIGHHGMSVTCAVSDSHGSRIDMQYDFISCCWG